MAATDSIGNDRIMRLLFDFYKRRQTWLPGPDIDASFFDRSFDDATSELCRQLAAEPNLNFDSSPRQVRLLLNFRIIKLLFSAFALKRKDEQLLIGRGDDTAALALIFEHVVARMSLPDELHGRPAAALKPGWMN